MFGWLFARREKANEPLRATHAAVLARNVWQHRWLPAAARERMHLIVAEMLAGRRWEGAGGLVATDEMRVTVAGAASLLALGFDEVYAFDRLPSIVLYRGAFRTPEPSDASDGGDRLGEAWQGGPIVLSWADAVRDTRRRGKGNNLVLHEFAHHVDGLWGDMDGAPALRGGEARRWNAVVDEEHARLVGQSRRDEATLLDHYGASNRAEFFAVATECFFERPHEMRTRHGELYDLLTTYYRQDPTEWAPPPDRASRRGTRRRETTHADRHTGRLDTRGLGLRAGDAAFARALERLEAESYEQAVRLFDRVLEEDSDDAEARAHRAEALLAMDDAAAARDDALAALAADRDNALAASVAAEACLALELDDEAAEHARRALRLEPDNVDALVTAGVAALRLGRRREAARRLRRAVAFDPFDDDAHYWLACVFEAAGKQQKADWHFRRAEVLAGGQPGGDPDPAR